MSETGSDDARLSELVEAHFDFIWRLLRRQGLTPADADDAAQQVFMVATQKLDSIETGHERSYLYGTALRISANTRRSIARRREAPEEVLASRPTATGSPERETELARARALLAELMSRLPAELARVLALAEIEEVGVREIAALEELPVGTAASRLRRARTEFRKLLSRAEDRNPFAKERP